MKALKSDRVVMVDCDDTLVIWDKSAFPEHSYITIDCYGYNTVLVPHQKNINLVHKFAKLGYTIIVWSGSGWEWAEQVGKAVGIDNVVSLYLSKPRYYFDDIPCQEWMGERLWREPTTGSED